MNLLPCLTGESGTAPHESLYWRFGPQRAIRRGPWKLVWTPVARSLFDLSRDPEEQRDLAGERPRMANDLAGALPPWPVRSAPPADARRASFEMEREMAERLAALGYIE